VSVTIPAGAIQAHVTVEPTEVRIEDGAIQVAMHPAAIHMPAVEVSNVVPFPHVDAPALEMPFRLLDDDSQQAAPAGEPEASADGGPAAATTDEVTDEATGAAA
jgi:hypothetical protein